MKTTRQKIQDLNRVILAFVLEGRNTDALYQHLDRLIAELNKEAGQ